MRFALAGLLITLWAIESWGQGPIDLTPNEPPLRPAIGPLLQLADGGARLVALPHDPAPSLGGREDALFDYLEASDGTVYRLTADRIYCWRPGTSGDAAQFQAPGGPHFAALVEDQLVGWYQWDYDGGRDLVELRFSGCGPDFDQISNIRIRESGDLPSFLGTWTHRSSGELLPDPGGGQCGVGPEGIGCADFSAEPPRFEMWATAAGLAARLPDGGFPQEVLAASPSLDQEGEITYALRDAQVLPDHRIAAILTASLPSRPELRVFVNWVILIDLAEDTVEALLEPDIQTLGASTIYEQPLGSADSVHYDAEWHALWVGRVFRWQPSSFVLSIEDVGTVDDVVTLGRTGMGYRIVPLDDPGDRRSGYFDMTNAMMWLNPCENDRQEDCVPFGRLVFSGVSDRAGGVWFKPGLNFFPRALVFDRDAVDLDGDGLLRGEEVALGTSDFDVDSDDDGAFDHLEILVGRDPTTPDSPPAEAKRILPSELLEGVPGPGPSDVTVGYSYAVDAPYCEYGQRSSEGRRGRCLDLAGRVLAEWITDNALDTPIVSADGTFVLINRMGGLYQIDLATGEESLWISAADLHAQIGEDITGGPESGFGAFQHWVPVNRSTLFYGTSFDRFSQVRKGRLPRYERMDGAPGEPKIFTTLFDTEHDFCDAHLVRCDVDPLDHIFEGTQEGPGLGLPYEYNYFWTVSMGWHHELRRFLVGIGGHQQSVILGFHLDPEVPPALLSRERGLYPLERPSWYTEGWDWCSPFPGQVHALGEGLYRVGGQVWRGAALEPVDVGYAPGIVPQKTECGGGSVQPYIAEWGGPSFAGHIGSSLGLMPVEPLRVDPGDTLLISAVGNLPTGLPVDEVQGQRMLYALGPLAALRPVWDAPDPDLLRGTGLDVTPDFRVCVADRPGQQVIEYLPEPDTHRPTIRGRRITDVDAIDCLWWGDRLLILTGEAVLEADEAGQLDLIATHGAEIPVDLLPGPDGWRVLDRGQPEAPAGYIVGQDGALTPIAPTALGIGAFNEEIRIEIDGRQPTTVFHAFERPDGTVLIAHSSTLPEVDPYGVEIFGIAQGVYMLDGRGGVRQIADPFRYVGGQVTSGELAFQVIGQVPGDGPDVWDGAKGPVCWFDPDLPECQRPAPSPSEADGGLTGDGGLAGGGGDGADPDEGCDCRADGGGPTSTLFFVLMATYELYRRRKRWPMPPRSDSF